MRHSGFTLIELLIVVAIIGVLSTIGVPTFRRMIQKSKQAEAKVVLGQIYKAEAVFFAEFNFYINGLTTLGMDWESTTHPFRHTGTYAWGFPPGGDCRPTQAMQPSEPAIRAIMEQRYPDYYIGLAGGQPVTLQSNLHSGSSYCLPGYVTSTGNAFLATSSAVIQPGVDPATADPTKIDQWSMDNSRQLSNVFNGIR